MKPSKANIKGKPLMIAAAVAGVLAVAAVALAIYTFSYGKIFPNVMIDDVEAGGKTAEQIALELDGLTTREYEQVELDIVVGENVTNVTAGDLKADRDSVGAAQAAMSIGRTGNAFNRMWTVLKCLFAPGRVSQEVLFDETAMSELMAKVSQQNNVAPVDAAYTVDGNVMKVTPPADGVKVDEEALRQLIKERFESRDYSDIVMDTVTAQAKRLDMDEVYAAVHTQVKDATMMEENGEHKISPHVVGVDFDLADAKVKLSQNPDKAFDVPLTVTQPKVTTIMLEATLFKDTLSEKTTYFSPKKVSRTHNVNLAAKLINGTVLNPGEVFSYNDTVGPRTAARGFKEAQIFAAGEVVDGLGGGICQVSSTLYMAALQADMKTVSRRNHSFYVDYAPKGQDATVVYGSIDFKFENTSPYPIRIEAYQKNNYIRVTIKGTKTQNKTVKITTKTLSTKPFTEKVVQDNSLKPGQRVIEQKGQEGITMQVYRWVYDENGKLITSYLENKTNYIPMQQIVRVGPSSTGAAATAPVTTPTAPTQEAPQPEEPPAQPTAPTTPQPPETQAPPQEETAPPEETDGGDEPGDAESTDGESSGDPEPPAQDTPQDTPQPDAPAETPVQDTVE